MNSFWDVVSAFRVKRNVQKNFPHVTCDDEHLPQQYYSSAVTARERIIELDLRSWEYQYEFIKFMEQQSREAAKTYQDDNIKAASKVYDNWYVPQSVHPIFLLQWQ